MKLKFLAVALIAFSAISAISAHATEENSAKVATEQEVEQMALEIRMTEEFVKEAEARQAEIDEKIFFAVKKSLEKECSKVQIKDEVLTGFDCFDANYQNLKVFSYDQKSGIVTAVIEDGELLKKNILKAENENLELANLSKTLMPSLKYSEDFKVTSFSIYDLISLAKSQKLEQK
ncbi:hypothetical protein M2128_000136 [Polynucleobacter sphagniphilus]|uniref:hypothetical protein n=1 Tax=Polynucleobacter sphagniphilus TaxID=1743169 RepID=UPI00247429CF|nr:hypothetical protein [Polynucleobacter sphagniphilus]MDH6301234.1 hypothetical protein [Polynucleobacter sphagniphilus]